jgi:hypothetical protein
MPDILQTLLILCPLVFLAGFIDSIAGGGGLISLPAYLLTGIPVHNALATNKFSSFCGTSISLARFLKSGYIHLKSAAFSVAFALAGSYAGAKLALALDEKYLRYFLTAALPVIAVFVLTRKSFGESNRAAILPDRKIILLSSLSGLVIGAYDGFFGPGTGTFLILIYTGVVGFDLTTASGNTKVINAASNLAALVTFLASGKVLIIIGIPAALFNILGGWIGSGLAIRKGAKVIRPVFIGVLVLLFLKVGYDIITGA